MGNMKRFVNHPPAIEIENYFMDGEKNRIIRTAAREEMPILPPVEFMSMIFLTQDEERAGEVVSEAEPKK